VAAVVVIVFALPRAMPGDPLRFLDTGSQDAVTDVAVRDQLAAYYGLDRPLVGQFGHFLDRLGHGDLGVSISRRVPVSDLLRAHLPWTLLLVATAMIVSCLISYLVGLAAGWRRGRTLDRVVVAATSAVRAVPTYALASLLLLGLAVSWPVLPLGGARTPFARYASPLAELGDLARHLALPVTALAAALVGSQALLVRNTVVSTLGQDYMVLARAKGLPRRLLKHRHSGRNALLPFVTSVGLQTGFLVGGAIFVETVFAYPGMGALVLQAVTTRDYPVLEATFLALALVVLTLNLAVDLLYARLDPRARVG
jgi:peptide/nickel transport system permease protein